MAAETVFAPTVNAKSVVYHWPLIFVCVVTFCVPFYNRIEPTLFGFPFFYWFQLAWIFVCMIVTAFAYYVTEPHEKSE